MNTIRFRPLQTWLRPFTKERRNSPFTAGYKDTLDKLENEIEQLSGKNVVIQLAITEDDLRQDGWPRASARPTHPGVIVTFDCRHGALSFACDEFQNSPGKQGWQANIRGIALTLERLRLVDLYGVTKSGEQYTGWKALPAAPEPTAAQTHSPEVVAANVLLRACGGSYNGEHVRRVLSERDYFKAVYRQAAQKTHPDSGGSHQAAQQVNTAAEILKRRHGL